MKRRYHLDVEDGTQIFITIMGWIAAIALGATGITILIIELIRLLVWAGKAIH